MNNLAIIYQYTGRKEQARQFFDEALDIRKSVYDKNHPKIAQVMINIANLCRDERKFDEAKDYYSKAIKIDEEVYGVDHLETAVDYANYALFCCMTGDMLGANEFFGKSIEIKKRNLPALHPDIAKGLGNWAGAIHLYQNKFEESKLMYREAIKIWSTYDINFVEAQYVVMMFLMGCVMERGYAENQDDAYQFINMNPRIVQNILNDEGIYSA